MDGLWTVLLLVVHQTFYCHSKTEHSRLHFTVLQKGMIRQFPLRHFIYFHDGHSKKKNLFLACKNIYQLINNECNETYKIFTDNVLVLKQRRGSVQLHRGSATTYKIKQSMDFKYVFIIKKLSSVCVCLCVWPNWIKKKKNLHPT